MNKSTWESTVKPVVVLSVIALVVSFLLALVNSFTAPIIEENQKAATLAAYVDVMPTVSSASDLEEVTDYTTENVTGVVKAEDGSIAIKAEEKGFDGGILTVIMGYDTNGTVTGIWVDASTQTKGIGSKVMDNEATSAGTGALDQFVGKSGAGTLVVKQNIDASIEAAAADAQGKIWNGVRPPVMPIPIHDGDGVRENGTPYGPECKGCWVITASSKNKPQVVHQSDINTELLPQDIYSGMYARVTINFFGYNRAGKRGVGCGLGNVMKTRDGEALAGGASAAADFAGVGMEAGAPATPAYGAAMPATPGQMAYPNTGMQQPNPLGVQPGAINPLTGQPYFG